MILGQELSKESGLKQAVEVVLRWLNGTRRLVGKTLKPKLAFLHTDVYKVGSII